MLVKGIVWIYSEGSDLITQGCMYKSSGNEDEERVGMDYKVSCVSSKGISISS
jgi:hypothetical protein